MSSRSSLSKDSKVQCGWKSTSDLVKNIFLKERDANRKVCQITVSSWDFLLSVTHKMGYNRQLS